MVIHSRLNAPDWADEEGGGSEGARCRKFIVKRNKETGQVDEDPWFKDAEEALPVCNGDYIGSPCPMRRSCLHMALINNDSHGVWGGLTSPQRRWIRRNVAKDKWYDDQYLRETVPEPGYFKDLGNQTDDEDDEDETRPEDEAEE